MTGLNLILTKEQSLMLLLSSGLAIMACNRHLYTPNANT